MAASVKVRPKIPVETRRSELEEKIRRRAHDIYLRRGDRAGSDLDDWLQAEKEVLQAQEDAIDESSMESFPASDPPAY